MGQGLSLQMNGANPGRAEYTDAVRSCGAETGQVSFPAGAPSTQTMEKIQGEDCHAHGIEN